MIFQGSGSHLDTPDGAKGGERTHSRPGARLVATRYLIACGRHGGAAKDGLGARSDEFLALQQV